MPQANNLPAADFRQAAVDEGMTHLPEPDPTGPLAGWGEPFAPLGHWPSLAFGSFLRRQGIQPGIVPQPREVLDAGRAILRRDQRPDHAPQGIAAVEDRQVLALGDPGLFAEQFHGQLTLAAEGLGTPGLPGPRGQLRLAEVEPTGDGQKPGGLPRLVQQGSQDDPVERPDGGGPVGAAGGVLVERAGAPDMSTAAVDLGVIEGRDTITMPEPA